ncbi:hypothetical protein JYU34_002302 [Plutella xylostella]|uniref:Arf-GAP domain-containing protein n=1 Tax=Plutella xylostella TaxID=51655 RepID=A0ABQ7R1U4_PLUXY|nr:hypothetical protein JYU34_002302 [Plutella xylostella]
MAASRRKQDDKNLATLRELISVKGNKYCFDCNQRGPTYVNTTIGSFVCSKCSGMLRGLTPPHRVKSISMTTFTDDEMEFIVHRGNDHCRRLWLGLYEGESVNYADEQSVKDFMSDKYEKKRYHLGARDGHIKINVTRNGVSSKNKEKSKSGGAATESLISILPPASKGSASNGPASTAKVVNNLLVNEVSHKLARPVNNSTNPSTFGQPFLGQLAPPAPPAPPQPSVPDFPVDFSTANIYNSSQVNSSANNNNNKNTMNGNNITMNNNFETQPFPTAFSAGSPPTSSANDRYAALADLDHALRQQNMKHLVTEENSAPEVNRNPFQTSTSSDFFGKNPFFNGGWSPAPSAPVNPFMQPAHNGGFVHSNNPFL